MRKDASATAELNKVIKMAQELIQERPPNREGSAKRTGSAKAILGKS